MNSSNKMIFLNCSGNFQKDKTFINDIYGIFYTKKQFEKFKNIHNCLFNVKGLLSYSLFNEDKQYILVKDDSHIYKKTNKLTLSSQKTDTCGVSDTTPHDLINVSQISNLGVSQ